MLNISMGHCSAFKLTTKSFFLCLMQMSIEYLDFNIKKCQKLWLPIPTSTGSSSACKSIPYLHIETQTAKLEHIHR